jgi:D-3-phosphoglycerate dehydrogenase / 2-oxoglutarate reductase
MKRKVLVSAVYIQPVIGKFGNIFKKNNIRLIVPKVKERLSEAELLKVISDIDGVISGDDEFTEKVLNNAPNLKVISKWGTGINSIDLEVCKKLGIIVCNTPGAFTDPVADTVMGNILSFSRNIISVDKKMKKGIWQKVSGVSLNECTLGVIGVGNIGKAVVKRAVSFGMKVLGNDIVRISKKFILKTGLEVASKEDILKRSDFLSLNCDLNTTSYHLIGKKEFSKMKRQSYLINTSRGSVIHEKELIRALRQKRIAGAALDVFEIEPLPKDSPLCKMDNVILAPHNSNSSPECWERVHLNTINNLLNVLQGGNK